MGLSSVYFSPSPSFFLFGFVCAGGTVDFCKSFITVFSFLHLFYVSTVVVLTHPFFIFSGYGLRCFLFLVLFIHFYLSILSFFSVTVFGEGGFLRGWVNVLEH
jgi:hypothetical protein